MNYQIQFDRIQTTESVLPSSESTITLNGRQNGQRVTRTPFSIDAYDVWSNEIIDTQLIQANWDEYINHPPPQKIDTIN